MKSIKNKILQLRKELSYHEYLYHTLNVPVISDSQYDILMTKLKFLESKYQHLITLDSPTQKIGSIIRSDLQPVYHITPMLSLDNIFDIDSYLIFEKKIQKYFKNISTMQFCCELKIDGLALSLLYKYGKLVYAATRGNGTIGENVTKNALTIKSLPLCLNKVNLPKILEVRGEVFMKNNDFKKLNHRSLIKGEKLFSNPRNAASGSLRHNDVQITKTRNLMFYAYGCNIIQGINNLYSHFDSLQKLEQWGFPISKHTLVCKNSKEVLFFYNKIQNIRNTLDFNIDGIVIKVDNLNIQKKIGYISKSPRWAVAFKFPAKQKITEILHVDFQVGRTGRITPVARLKPINISGVRITNVSLHSNKEIKRIGLHIGDLVTICRSGDVIPKVINIIKSYHAQPLTDIIFPKHCPVCKYNIIQKKNNGHAYCSGGFHCSAQRKKSMLHFFSKKGLNVYGLGPKTINNLIDDHFIKTPADIFTLDLKMLKQLKDMGHQSAINLLQSLHKAKIVTLYRFIYALGIHDVGEMTARLLSKYFLSLQKIMDTDILTLSSLPGIGNIIAVNILSFIKEKTNRKLIFNLSNTLNIYTSYNQKTSFKNSACMLLNKKIVLTGTLDGISRNTIIKKIKSLGGIVVNYISKTVDLIFIGKNPGIKLIKAKNLGIKIYNIEYFLQLFK
ncbi:MAG TPA: NAD-dependent DNA ligase LigA [Buchnera sp. (in: enterobacteria)]|nr:NAD-dependent DNA ligase LigA [Buchnera sp. (in: enterobacteria)]